MKGLPTLIRVYRWRLDEKRRKLADLERFLADLREQSKKLEADLVSEQERAARSEEVRHAYPAYAEAMIDRRRVLAGSMAKVDASIAEVREEMAVAFETVKTHELAEERQQQRARTAAARRERLRLDEVGLDMYRRQRKRNA